MLKGRATLADIFLTNPFSDSLNGSLWTLRYEFTCYLIVGFLGVLGVLNHRWCWFIWLVAIFFTAITPLPTEFFKHLPTLIAYFTSGMLAYLYRDYGLSIYLKCLLLVSIIVFLNLNLNLIYISPILAFTLIKIAYMDGPLVGFGKYGDFSYGMYIYACPIQQFIVFLMVKSIIQPMTFWMVFLVSFPITLLCSIASYHLVEKRFLKKRRAQLS